MFPSMLVCLSCVSCLIVLIFSFFYKYLKLFGHIFSFYWCIVRMICASLYGVHPSVVCMPLHICVCPIALRIFDSVYLNVSYRRSWKDMEQETPQVGHVYSVTSKHFLLYLFLLYLYWLFLFFLVAPCQQYPSAFLLA